MIALSGENSLKMSGDLLGVERKSSSFSSGILGMSGYSRSWRFLSSLTLGIKILDLLVRFAGFSDVVVICARIRKFHNSD